MVGVAGNNLERLSSALLNEIGYLYPPEARQHSMKRIAEQLVPPQLKPGRQSRAHLTQRLYHTIQQLNRRNYQARWEAHTTAPRLILENCPYKAIIGQHPELCQIDALILELMLDKPVHQLAKLAPDARGVPLCVFQIGDNR